MAAANAAAVQLSERAFAVLAAHIGTCLAHRVDCFALHALAATCRAGRAGCGAAAAQRAAGVRAAAHALAARRALAWLLRPSAMLDDFLRAALFDAPTGEKLAELKLSRVMCPPGAPAGDAGWHLGVMHHGGGEAQALSGVVPVAVALWRCAPPDCDGVPRQAAAPELLSPSAAAAELARLFAAGFVPIRRRGWYNARPGEAPLWARP